MTAEEARKLSDGLFERRVASALNRAMAVVGSAAVAGHRHTSFIDGADPIRDEVAVRLIKLGYAVSNDGDITLRISW